MDGFGLLMGHLIGDFVVQNDWMAKWKTAPYPVFIDWGERQTDGEESMSVWERGNLACLIHCVLYTLAVWACSFWWMPWWGLAAVFFAHYPVDRFRLARWWMCNVSGQGDFANGQLSPWSVIVVDNVFHLLVLFVIGIVAAG